MSRRRPPRKSLREDDETVVNIVCSDRGQHVPPRVLGKIEIFGPEDHDVEITNNTTQDDALTARMEDPNDPHITEPFKCRKCGRNPRIRRDKLIAAARVMATNGESSIDISVIELLSTPQN